MKKPRQPKTYCNRKQRMVSHPCERHLCTAGACRFEMRKPSKGRAVARRAECSAPMREPFSVVPPTGPQETIIQAVGAEALQGEDASSADSGTQQERMLCALEKNALRHEEPCEDGIGSMLGALEDSVLRKQEAPQPFGRGQQALAQGEHGPIEQTAISQGAPDLAAREESGLPAAIDGQDVYTDVLGENDPLRDVSLMPPEDPWGFSPSGRTR